MYYWNHLKLNQYTKAWLRLTYLMNSVENQGFLVQFVALNILICYTWRFYRDVSWMLNHRKTKNCPNFKIRVYSFGLWGWASFWVWTGLWPDLTQSINFTSTPKSPSSCKPITSVCASQSLQSDRVLNHH